MIKSAYIHIPFCNQICTYCDFPKMVYQDKWIHGYLEALNQEIKMNYQNESFKTIYIGGGTPSALSINEFKHMLNIVDQFKKEKNYEYTIECNIESLTEEKIKYMKMYGVNRISIGVQTFQEKNLELLNRHHQKDQVFSMVKLLKQYGLTNINIDLIYALPNETIDDVISDIEAFLKLEIPHISTYSLIIEPNTTLYIQKIQPIQEDLDEKMYRTICNMLKKYGYHHYEISNFSKPGYESKHNLTYWNNEEYYGFGLGASGYKHPIRYNNTKSLTNYCKGHFRLEQEVITPQIQMENEMILGLRKRQGVSRSHFIKKYGVSIESVFPIERLIQQKQLKMQGDFIFIPEDKIYISNDILVEFILEKTHS